MQPSKMKAILYRRYGGPEVLEYADADRPEIGDHEVLVRVHASSINAVDYRMMRADPFLIRGVQGLLRPKRRGLGIDVAGVVEATGPGVTRFEVGDEVFGDAFQDGMGGFAEYVAIRETALAAKPEGLSFEQAAAVPLAGVTALQALRDLGGVQPGMSVLVHGAGGGVGTFAVQLARALGAEVTAVCGARNTKRLSALGADRVIDYAEEDFTQRAERYDVILGVNGYRPLAEYKRCLKPAGRYVMIGGTTRQLFEALLLARFVFSGEQSASTLTIDDSKRAGDLQELAALLSAGELEPLIDREFELGETAEAMRYVERGHVRGKVVLRVRGAETVA